MACDQPFESGGLLCGTCRKRPLQGGARFCSRLVVRSPPMKALVPKLATVAATAAPVVLQGEGGAGKEVLARAIHANSPRKGGPFVAVNCAALDAELLDAALFGLSRGGRKGLLEEATGGTLLLDEVEEMPLGVQGRLLRVIQDGEFRRVGEVAPHAADARIICATHVDLRQRVREGRFRQDLYFRLKIFTLSVPALRQRTEDIPALASMFLEHEGHPTRRLTSRAVQALLAYAWPGNVRELGNAMTHGAVLSGGEDVDLVHLPEELLEPAVEGRAPVDPEGLGPAAALESLEQVERRHVSAVLRSCDGRVTDAARILGIGRTTLWRKMKAYGLEGA